LQSATPLPARNKAWVLKQLRQLQPFPPVVAQLMRVVSVEDVSFKQMAELIRSDAAVAGEVLRLANSPLLDCRRQVNSILHAVAILGLERLRGLIMTLAMREFLSPTLRIPVLLRCWRHNLACALLCEELSGAYYLGKDPSYTAGFLHDIGRLALLASFPAEYAQMLGVAALHHLDVRECEQGAFGIDHCAAGTWLVEEWQFPAEFREITGRHHDPPDDERFDMTALVQVACRTADTLGFDVAGAGCHGGPQDLPEPAKRRFPSDTDLMLAVAEKVNALECGLLA
jgi:HD-like signal output (HDOD) protein